jgi:hypothetical protein
VGTTVTFVPGQYTTNNNGTLTLTAAVPEISTLAMLLSGCAVLGFVGYRRRLAA